MTAYQHIPVLKNEVVALLQPQPGQSGIDCTLGGGGHTEALLQQVLPKGKILAFEWDAQTAIHTAQMLKKYGEHIHIAHRGYQFLLQEVQAQKFGPVSFVLADLGYSSLQLADTKRGFSFESVGRLDMRYSDETSLTADQVLKTYTKEQLTTLFQTYGQERFAAAIADAIVTHRMNEPVTGEVLREICRQVYQRRYKKKSRKDPATKVWQALRIVVNNEFENIHSLITAAMEVLEIGGRLGIITFHSLEDALVKKTFVDLCTGCVCPREFPICVCGKTPYARKITTKAIKPTLEEIQSNPRARSAQLRVIEKILNT